MRNGYWVIRTYEAGCVGEKIKYFVPGEKPTKSIRKLRSDIKKQEQNEASAVKRLARILNANFSHGDYLIGLDYTDDRYRKIIETAGSTDPDDIRNEAEAELRRYLRRVKRACEKQGVELKYAAVTADIDGKTGESVRVHHHLVINREAFEAAKAKWDESSVDWNRLSSQPDYTPIADYFMRQVRRVPDAKKYMSSRNLIRVIPKDRIARSGSEIRPPKGTVLVHRTEYKPGMPQYIRYYTPADHPSGSSADSAPDKRSRI